MRKSLPTITEHDGQEMMVKDPFVVGGGGRVTSPPIADPNDEISLGGHEMPQDYTLVDATEGLTTTTTPSRRHGRHHHVYYKSPRRYIRHGVVTTILVATVATVITIRNTPGSLHSFRPKQVASRLITSELPVINDILRQSGWSLVAVYNGDSTGSRSSSETPSSPLHHHKNKQAMVVLDALGNKTDGYYVDIASSSSASSSSSSSSSSGSSNTLALEEEYGWRGLCINPTPGSASPWYYPARKCQIVQGGVGGGGGSGKKKEEDENDEKEEEEEEEEDEDEDEEQASSAMVVVPIDKSFDDLGVPHVIDYLSLSGGGPEVRTNFDIWYCGPIHQNRNLSWENNIYIY